MQAPNWADEDTKQHLFENVIHIIIYIKKDVFFLFYNATMFLNIFIVLLVMKKACHMPWVHIHAVKYQILLRAILSQPHKSS